MAKTKTISKEKGKSKKINSAKPTMHKTEIEDTPEQMEVVTEQEDAVVDSSKEVTKEKTPCSPCQLKYINDRIKARRILIAIELGVVIGIISACYIAKKRGISSSLYAWVLLAGLAFLVLAIKDIVTLNDLNTKKKAMQQALLLEQKTKSNQSNT